MELTETMQEMYEILRRERAAISHLEMGRLADLQQEKTRILARLARHTGDNLDEEQCLLAGLIQAENKRNGRLIAAGLNFVTRLQRKVYRRLALTYTHGGHGVEVDTSPRLLAWRC